MARRWQIIRVELVSGRGQVFMPPPGRDLILPPSTTFEELGLAIDQALARWDLAHLREFALADGTRVVEDRVETADFSGFVGPLLDKLLEQTKKVKAYAQVGDVFRYVFDLGDDWTCRCTVTGLGDPERLYGIVPDTPVVFWGWGSLPDQYGRTRPDDGAADGEQPDARRQAREEQEVLRFVTEFGRGKPAFVELGALRAADASGDARAVLDALIAVDVEPALQQVGQALAHVWDAGAAPGAGRPRGRLRDDLIALTLALAGRLNVRDAPGDALLSKALLARARGEQPEGDPLPVDLEVLADTMASYGDAADGAYLDLDTGQVLPADLVDQTGRHGAGASGLEEGIEELDVEPGHRWERIDGGGRREQGAERRAFIDYLNAPTIGRQANIDAADALRQALDQRGGNRRFHDALGELGLVDQWLAFRDDRRWGRARVELASHGLRPVRPQRP
ncbi:IS1096 element passenger TnpR family protein [Actinomyces ruminicola]|uniref:IS1096 element passenger TnpR family protein n=1 Tax=Actinomyces ruminicola TaxID=332524 RepID=UPI0011CB447C|nr:plasmid pRiA4b ORF-3 family protein [Actinomyces ruminicola]